MYQEQVAPAALAELSAAPLVCGGTAVAVGLVREGRAGRFPQVVAVDLATGRAAPLTLGTSSVAEVRVCWGTDQVVGWDRRSGEVYYTASPAEAPHTRHVYRVAAAPRPQVPR